MLNNENHSFLGVEYETIPETNGVPLVVDMSSNIMTRNIDVTKFSCIIAGCQKNLGPAGTTMVIVRKDMLDQVDRPIPTMLDYRTHIKKNSAFNTPPVYPIYVSMLTLRWIKENGGVSEMQKRNQQKADLFYEVVDQYDIYEGVVAKEDRSIMNATFFIKDPQLDTAFLEACTKADISTIKGHRTVGGFRASMYNAMPLSSVEHLVEVMHTFAKKHS